MKKEQLIAQLEGVKVLSTQVDIDKVIELLGQIEPEVRVEKVFGFGQEIADVLLNKIERVLDYNSDDLVDTGSAEFDISYSNQLELRSASINVYDTMEHITACIDEFIVAPEEEEEDEAEAPYEIDDHVFIERADDNGDAIILELDRTLDNEMS